MPPRSAFEVFEAREIGGIGSRGSSPAAARRTRGSSPSVRDAYAVSGWRSKPVCLPGRTFAADFRERFDRRPGPYAAYGFEAMRVALDGIGERGS